MINVVQCELLSCTLRIEEEEDWQAVSWINKNIAIQGNIVSLPQLGFFPLLKGYFEITKVYHSPILPVEWFQKKKQKNE